MAGLQGAYAPISPDDAERIYLNSTWLELANPEQIEAVLLVEVEADTSAAAAQKLEAVLARCKAGKQPPIGARTTTDPEDVAIYWELARKVVPTIVGDMLKAGVIARAMPQGDIIGFAPPFCLTREEADKVVGATAEAIKASLG